MRQGQQHRRGRGRNNNNGGGSHHQGQNNNNNRKGQNPLTRSFESNGPDVKIRGTPAHVAEKYVALARDAHAVGDPVLAENYLQHAEHYNRIILAYREQQGETAGGSGGTMMRQRQPGDPSIDGDFSDDDGSDEFGGDSGGQMPLRGQEPQPSSFESPRYEDRPQRDNNAPRHQQNRQHNRDRHPGDRQDGGEPRRFQQDRPDYRGGGETRGDGRTDNRRDQHQPQRSEPRHDRFERPERNFDRGNDQPGAGMRNEPDQRPQPRFDRPERGERIERHEPVDRQPAIPVVAAETVAAEPPLRRREPRAAAPVPSHEQPEFLRRPVRRPRREPVAESTEDAPASDDTGNQE